MTFTAILLGTGSKGVCPFATGSVDRRRRRSSFVVVHHKVSGSIISRTVWHRITKLYMTIHTDLLNSRTGYDIDIYFRPEVIAKKNCLKCHFALLRVEFIGKRFKQWSPSFNFLTRTIGLTNLLDMTSLAASGRLENAIKCCKKGTQRV